LIDLQQSLLRILMQTPQSYDKQFIINFMANLVQFSLEHPVAYHYNGSCEVGLNKEEHIIKHKVGYKNTRT